MTDNKDSSSEMTSPRRFKFNLSNAEWANILFDPTDMVLETEKRLS